MHRWAAWVFLVMSLAAAPAAARGAGPGSAARKPVVVERKTFDPEHPPTPAPPITADESAVCVSSSNCSASIETETAARRKTPAGFEVDVRVLSAHVAVGLTITLWLPKSAPQWLIEHEDTHRRIVERVYATADKVALAAARTCSGRIFTGAGTTVAAARKDGILKAEQSLIDDYNAHVCAVWSRVNEIFDTITAHGRRSNPARAHPVDAKAAMAAAFAQYAKEAAAPTQPAARAPAASGSAPGAPAAAGASTQKR